jgi:deoxycytidine triphosphate deaminase
MIFSKHTILKKIDEKLIAITPFDGALLEEASYDLRLGSFLNQASGAWEPVSSSGLVIQPGSFLLAKTQEKITLSPAIACLVFTTSSIARKGIDVAQSSAFCHPKTDNQITLEVVNHNNQPITLLFGDVVAKAIFTEVI